MLPLWNEYRDKMIADGRPPASVYQETKLCRYFEIWYGSSNVRKVSQKDFERYKTYLMVEHKTRYWNTRLKPSTIEKRLFAIKSYFKFLEARKAIILDPTIYLTVPKAKPYGTAHLLSEKEIQKLLEKPNTRKPLGLRDRLIFELFYVTAMRRGELVKLKVSDIDMKEKYIYPSRLKGGRECAIPILPSTYHILEKYLNEARPQILKWIGKPDIPEVFITTRGTRCSVEHINTLFKRYRGDQKHIHPHALRHSCATHMLKNGADIRNIQALLGHRSIKSTQRYTRVVVEDLKAAQAKYHPREKQFKKVCTPSEKSC